MSIPQPDDLSARFPAGTRAAHEYTLSQTVYDSFMAAFDDTNALHVDEQYAIRHGFKGRVAHGAILNGFISHFVGVCFPAGNCILHSVDVTYRSPSYLGDRLRLEAEVAQVSDAVKVLELRISLRNLTQEKLAAKAQVRVGFL